MLRVSAVRGSRGKRLATKDTEAEVCAGREKPKAQRKNRQAQATEKHGDAERRGAIGWTWFPEDTVGQGEEQALRSGAGNAGTQRRKNALTVFTWEMAKDRSWTCTKQEQEEAS
ncbi:hypothetical protein ERJ75_001720100 [Trypanosoma vivax]|nr:hypothetical protein ERJ75_001720100 [Trypanosoma vivax]